VDNGELEAEIWARARKISLCSLSQQFLRFVWKFSYRIRSVFTGSYSILAITVTLKFHIGLIRMASTMLFVASAFPSASVSAHENLKVLLVFVSVISLSITFCVLRNHGFCLSAEKMQENIMNKSFYFQFFFHFLGSGMAGCGGW